MHLKKNIHRLNVIREQYNVYYYCQIKTSKLSLKLRAPSGIILICQAILINESIKISTDFLKIRMAVNFCNEKFVKISCDKVCSDHHNVQNLISANETDRQKGFLVEYYIRPPVTIKIEFTKHNFDLMYIELGLQMRQHRSNGIEIYVITNTSQDSQLISKCFNQNQNKLTIVNSCYRPNRHLPQIDSTFLESFSIAGRNIKHCSNINCILIKILSTVNSTVPCLRYILLF